MTMLMRRFGKAFDNNNWRGIVRRLHRNVMMSTSRDDASFWWGERTLNGMLRHLRSIDGTHWSVAEPMARGHLEHQIRRPDLWFGFGGVRDGWFTLEAKIIWPRQFPRSRGGEAAPNAPNSSFAKLGDDFRVRVSPLAGCWVVPRREARSNARGQRATRSSRTRWRCGSSSAKKVWRTTRSSSRWRPRIRYTTTMSSSIPA